MNTCQINHDAECLSIEPKLGPAALEQLANDPHSTDAELRRAVRSLSANLSEVMEMVENVLAEMRSMHAHSAAQARCRCWECLHSELGNEPDECGCHTEWTFDDEGDA